MAYDRPKSKGRNMQKVEKEDYKKLKSLPVIEGNLKEEINHISLN